MRSNRKAAFDDVYLQYKDYVYQIAYLITKDLHTAEDITQEVFMRYYLHIASSLEGDPKMWLATLTRNLSVNSLRVPYHERGYGINEVEEDYFEIAMSSEDEFFHKLWSCELIECSEIILCGLKKKNPKWYDAITYVYGLELSHKDVARAMGITVKSLDGMLMRAKIWIRKKYREEYDRINYK